MLAITGDTPGTFRTKAEQRLGRLRSELDYLHIDEIIDKGLHEFIDNFQQEINVVGEAIFDTFFAHDPLGEQSAAATPAKSHATQTMSA
jgi:uncharacterized alpha-E superfamily protein